MSVMTDDNRQRSMIKLREIRKEYTLGRVKVRALSGVDLCIEEGTSP